MEHKINLKLMGSAFEIIVVDEDKTFATRNITLAIEEIKRIEYLLTEFSETSITALLNKNAGIMPIQVPKEFFQLVQRAQQISELTQGAFDLTVAPLKKLYNFKQQDFEFPSSKIIKNTLQKVGFKHIQLLPNNNIYLTKKGMRISFAAIGKGYAADCVRKLWQTNKVKSAAINASGDLAVFGTHAKGNSWKIGIPNPENKNEIILSIPLHEGAVATSGDYEQYFMKNDIRYAHTIHPKTGMPVKDIKSVSIFHQSAELCDALATAVFVMGTEIGLHFIEQLPNTHAIIIDAKNNVILSNRIQLQNAIS